MPCPFGAVHAAPGDGDKMGVLLVERRLLEYEQDVLLDLRLQVADGKEDAFRLAVACCAPFLTETRLESFFLLVHRQLRQQQRMADADLLAIELVYNHLGKLGQLQAGSDVGGWFPDLGRDLLDAVLRFLQVEKPFEASRLFQRMHVAALKVFDLSLVLQKQSMTYTTRGNRTSWNLYL